MRSNSVWYFFVEKVLWCVTDLKIKHCFTPVCTTKNMHTKKPIALLFDRNIHWSKPPSTVSFSAKKKKNGSGVSRMLYHNHKPNHLHNHPISSPIITYTILYLIPPRLLTTTRGSRSRCTRHPTDEHSLDYFAKVSEIPFVFFDVIWGCQVKWIVDKCF